MQIGSTYFSGPANTYSSSARQTTSKTELETVPSRSQAVARREDTPESLSFASLMAAQAGMDSGMSKSVEAATSVTATSAKSSTELRQIDIGNLLTDEDKRLTGWPSAQPNWAATYIALDRQDGSLRGPVTTDYLVGNPERHIVGLAERCPGTDGITSQAVNEMLERLLG